VGATAHGLTELIEDLRDAGEHVVEETRKVVSKGSLNIKKDVRARWQGIAHAPALPRAVTYDVKVSGTTVTGETGPDKAKRQGALGNLIEYGSQNNAPIPALSPALDAEQPRFLAAMENLAAGLLEGEKPGSEPAGD
jgi:hypothetical protein